MGPRRRWRRRGVSQRLDAQGYLMQRQNLQKKPVAAQEVYAAAAYARTIDRSKGCLGTLCDVEITGLQKGSVPERLP